MPLDPSDRVMVIKILAVISQNEPSGMCAQQRLAWASVQSDKSLYYPHETTADAMFLYDFTVRLLSKVFDQADLS